MKLRITPLLTLTAGTLATIGMGASAQTNSTSKLMLEEVVVTAEKRSQSVQSIPLAVTAFSQANMDLRDATDVRALQNFTPNLEFNNESGGQNNSRVTLRGIGTETLVGGGDPGVALHVDGVYVGRNSASAQSIFDVERLEVLRGPQGTLYGRNATGGSINIITKKATDEFEGSLDLTAGNYNRTRVRGVVNLPVTDNLYSRFSIIKEVRDGYLEKSFAGGGDNDDKVILSVRGQLLWDLENDNEIILRAFHTKVEGVGAGSKFLGVDTNYQFSNYQLGIADGSSGPPVGVPLTGPLYTNPATGSPAQPMSTDLYTISKNANEFVDLEHQGVDLTVEWNLSDTVMLRSITAYQTLDNASLVDADNSELAIEERARENQAEQYSQEFNLLSTGDDDLQWIVGAFYFHEEIEEEFSTTILGGLLDPSIPLPGGQLPGGNGAGQNPTANHETDSYAFFGQATYSVTDALRVTAGLRYSVDEKEQSRVNAGIVDFVTGVRQLSGGAIGPEAPSFVDGDWSSTTGKLSIDYDLNEDSLLYASFSTGFKSGGIPFNGVQDPYEPEEVDAFEVGSKNEFLDNRLRLNLAAFYYDYQDLQVFRLTGDGPKAENAAQSTVWGLEAEFQAVITESLKIDGSAGYLDAEYDDYTIDIPPTDYSGNTLNHAPENMVNVGVQYDTELSGGDFTARLDYVRRGDTYFDRANTDLDLQDAYGLVSANVRYEKDNWFVSLYGKNLGDKEYVTGQIINPPFNCGCRTVGVGEPRTYGVSVGMSWD
jgi:iron complex outermembrane receptor protein